MFGKTQHIHIIGIGGSGLSGIAEVLLDHDFHVSGSDIQESYTTEHLRKCGALVWNKHEASNIDGADVVVISPAIPDENPELQAAKIGKIPIIRGAEMLNEISRLRYSVAVSGTHGKTTTTAMTAAVLDRLDPTIVLGGKLVNGSNARRGHGEVMVIEADEAYGSIEMFYPTIAVVTSVDADHLDYYKNIQEIGETFLTFINKVPFYGSAILCLDQENIQKLIPKVDKKYITYGLDTRADLIAEEIEIEGPTSHYQVRLKGESCGKIHLKMPGRHNIANSLAAIAVGFEMDIPFEEMRIALESFQGVHRRFEVLGTVDDIVVVDDYAHNPAKLMAALKGAREGYNRRIIAVFQPHRFGRVQTLEDEFCRSFFQADVLIVTSIYGAGEEPIKNVTGENLAKAIKDHGHPQVIYISDMDEVVQQLMKITQPNDLVMTLGAGDIVKVGHKFLEQHSENTEIT
ncbi:UDP-N-acetylmuramate--L-alanine ligase [Candidatus Poribacteria bacterium]|nr:MAG: UDP-N-acetylmuramate--L-alanine ligase [Candidatus Poribacteria bacterium]